MCHAQRSGVDRHPGGLQRGRVVLRIGHAHLRRGIRVGPQCQDLRLRLTLRQLRRVLVHQIEPRLVDELAVARGARRRRAGVRRPSRVFGALHEARVLGAGEGLRRVEKVRRARSGRARAGEHPGFVRRDALDARAGQCLRTRLCSSRRHDLRRDLLVARAAGRRRHAHPIAGRAQRRVGVRRGHRLDQHPALVLRRGKQLRRPIPIKVALPVERPHSGLPRHRARHLVDVLPPRILRLLQRGIRILRRKHRDRLQRRQRNPVHRIRRLRPQLVGILRGRRLPGRGRAASGQATGRGAGRRRRAQAAKHAGRGAPSLPYRRRRAGDALQVGREAGHHVQAVALPGHAQRPHLGRLLCLDRRLPLADQLRQLGLEAERVRRRVREKRDFGDLAAHQPHPLPN